MPERFGGSEQLVEVEHAQEPSAPECGIIDRIGAGERTGVSERRFGAERLPAGFDHEHGLCARRSARGRHELARVFDRFDIEQDCARGAIEREIVKQIAEIDVELVADRGDRGKADAAVGCPIDHSGDNRAGLRHQRQFALNRHARREARVEFPSRHE